MANTHDIDQYIEEEYLTVRKSRAKISVDYAPTPDPNTDKVLLDAAMSLVPEKDRDTLEKGPQIVYPRTNSFAAEDYAIAAVDLVGKLAPVTESNKKSIPPIPKNVRNPITMAKRLAGPGTDVSRAEWTPMYNLAKEVVEPLKEHQTLIERPKSKQEAALWAEAVEIFGEILATRIWTGDWGGEKPVSFFPGQEDQYYAVARALQSLSNTVECETMQTPRDIALALRENVEAIEKGVEDGRKFEKLRELKQNSPSVFEYLVKTVDFLATPADAVQFSLIEGRETSTVGVDTLVGSIACPMDKEDYKNLQLLQSSTPQTEDREDPEDNLLEKRMLGIPSIAKAAKEANFYSSSGTHLLARFVKRNIHAITPAPASAVKSAKEQGVLQPGQILVNFPVFYSSINIPLGDANLIWEAHKKGYQKLPGTGIMLWLHRFDICGNFPYAHVPNLRGSAWLESLLWEHKNNKMYVGACCDTYVMHPKYYWDFLETATPYNSQWDNLPPSMIKTIVPHAEFKGYDKFRYTPEAVTVASGFGFQLQNLLVSPQKIISATFENKNVQNNGASRCELRLFGSYWTIPHGVDCFWANVEKIMVAHGFSTPLQDSWDSFYKLIERTTLVVKYDAPNERLEYAYVNYQNTLTGKANGVASVYKGQEDYQLSKVLKSLGNLLLHRTLPQQINVYFLEREIGQDGGYLPSYAVTRAGVILAEDDPRYRPTLTSWELGVQSGSKIVKMGRDWDHAGLDLIWNVSGKHTQPRKIRHYSRGLPANPLEANLDARQKLLAVKRSLREKDKVQRAKAKAEGNLASMVAPSTGVRSERDMLKRQKRLLVLAVSTYHTKRAIKGAKEHRVVLVGDTWFKVENKKILEAVEGAKSTPFYLDVVKERTIKSAVAVPVE